MKSFEGSYTYAPQGKDIYYFKFTKDSFYTLMIPKKYSTGHLYEKISDDTIVVFDVEYINGNKRKYELSLNKIELITDDSINIIFLTWDRIFGVTRCPKQREKEYDELVYKLLTL